MCVCVCVCVCVSLSSYCNCVRCTPHFHKPGATYKSISLKQVWVVESKFKQVQTFEYKCFDIHFQENASEVAAYYTKWLLFCASLNVLILVLMKHEMNYHYSINADMKSSQMFHILSGFGDINQHNMFPIFYCFTIPFKNILIVLSRYRPIFDGAFWTLWEPRQLILYAAAFCLYLLDNLKRAYYRQIQT